MSSYFPIWRGDLTFLSAHNKFKKTKGGEKMTGPDLKIEAHTKQNQICSDCGEKGTDYGHRGDLLPESERSEQWKNFCAFCFQQRQERRKRVEPPLPLGVKPPGVPKEFFNKAIRVKTESGSIYDFGVPNEESVRTVSNAVRKLNYTKCKVLLATVGTAMWLRAVDDPEKDSSHLVATTPVKSIEALS